MKAHFLSQMVKTSIAVFLLTIASPVLADSGESIIVKNVEGHGKDRQAALADAFQNAIRKALGTYVVTYSSTDGESLDEKIYLNSDAIVKNYRVVGRENGENAVSIFIDAEIIRNEMMKYIHREATEKVDGGELANLLNKRKAIDSAVKSLDLLFLNYQENLYRVEKYGSMSVAPDDDLSSDRILVSIPFILSFRWDAYRVWREKVTMLLDRIAIAKTSGRCKDWQAFKDLYGKSSFFKNNGADGDNPNGYRGVLFLDEAADSSVSYALFVVQSQIYQKLCALLDSDVDIRFTFSSPGGGDVVTYSLPSDVWFFQSSWMNSFVLWNDLDSGCLVFRNALLTEAGYETYWSSLNLFHAAVPVPASAVDRIRECSIRCVPRSTRSSLYRNSISRTPLSPAEWARIDNKPQVSVVSSTKKIGTTQQASSSRGETSTIHTYNSNPYVPIVISSKDKALKERVLALRNLVPDASSASQWFKLANEVESPELRQEMLMATGAALVFAKKNDAYQSKVRPLIENALDFERAFYAVCPNCKGAKSTIEQCKSCEGSGNCKYANCVGGRHRIFRIKGVVYENCHDCKGSGRCRKCDGTGKLKTSCYRCQGKGRLLSSDSIAKAYSVSIKHIVNAFDFEDRTTP